VAERGRAGRGQRPRTRAASVVVPFPRTTSGDRLELAPLVPSGRSLLIAFGVLGGILLALVLARETAIFGVRTIDVRGAEGPVARQVQRVLDDRVGDSLMGLDLDAARVAVTGLPTVAEVAFDRAYPHTLRVVIVPERPVAVVRQGADSYVVSERGRVMARAERTAQPALARIWVAKDTRLEPGAFVDGDLRTAVDAVTPLAGTSFPSRVVSVATQDGLTLRLGSGLELRLGDMEHVDLKLAVAARVLRLLPAGSGYLDVSVPDRPVAGPPGTDPQVEVETSASTGA
jgi:cell division protein FtsQ